jgi:hypothetical protein
MGFGDRYKKSEGDFVSASEFTDIGDRVASLESVNGGLQSGLYHSGGYSTTPTQVSPDVLPFRSRLDTGNIITVGYDRPYEISTGTLIPQMAMQDQINVIEVLTAARIVSAIDFDAPETIEIEYAGSETGVVLIFVYYEITKGTGWEAELKQLPEEDWPPLLDPLESFVIVGIAEIDTNQSNAVIAWHQLLKENKTVIIEDLSSVEASYLPFDAKPDGSDFEFQPGLIQIGVAEEVYAGQTETASANQWMYANIRFTETGAENPLELDSIALYNEAGDTDIGLLFKSAVDLDPINVDVSGNTFWRVKIGMWDGDDNWTQFVHGNLVYPDLVKLLVETISGGGGCTAVTGDDIWIKKDDADDCKVVHIGPGDTDNFLRWDGTDFYLGENVVTDWKIERDERGHIRFEVGVEQCNCDASSELLPTVNVTLSWTGSDLTYTYLGCEWSNGETKEICADNYDQLINGPSTYAGTPVYTNLELWGVAEITANDLIAMASSTGLSGYTGSGLWRVDDVGVIQCSVKGNYTLNAIARYRQLRSTQYAPPFFLGSFYNNSTSNLSTYTDMSITAIYNSFKGYLNDDHFGQITTTAISGVGNLTVKWERRASFRDQQKRWVIDGGGTI